MCCYNMDISTGQSLEQLLKARLLIFFILFAAVSCKLRNEDQLSQSTSSETNTSQNFPAVGALVAVLITPNTSGPTLLGDAKRYLTMTIPFCTAVLLSDNVVLTSEHCVPTSLDQFQNVLLKDANRWSLQNEGRVASPFLFFSNHPDIWRNNVATGYSRHLPGPAMQVVERELVAKMYDAKEATKATQWGGLILLRLSNKRFIEETNAMDPSFISEIELGDIKLANYPTLTENKKPENFIKKFIQDQKTAVAVGYGYDSSTGRAGQKRSVPSVPGETKGDFLWSNSERIVCQADGGGPLLATAAEPKDQEILGILHGRPYAWGFVFETYAAFTRISDVAQSCETFAQTDVYMMPQTQTKKISQIIKKWRGKP